MIFRVFILIDGAFGTLIVDKSLVSGVCDLDVSIYQGVPLCLLGDTYQIASQNEVCSMIIECFT